MFWGVANWTTTRNRRALECARRSPLLANAMEGRIRYADSMVRKGGGIGVGMSWIGKAGHRIPVPIGGGKTRGVFMRAEEGASEV